METLPEALRYTGGLWHTRGLDAGDVLSAVYDALLAAAANFDPAHGTRFFAYAKIYVRGEICKLQRVADKRRKAEVVWQDDIDEPWEETTYVPPRQAELPPYAALADPEPAFWREEYRRVKPLLDQLLTTRERAVLELAFQAGLNTQEISNALGIPRSSVHYVREHAFRKVRKKLIKSHSCVYFELQKLCI